MIRPLEEKDIDTVCGIVNENWKNAYSGYVNPLLLNAEGFHIFSSNSGLLSVRDRAAHGLYLSFPIMRAKKEPHVCGSFSLYLIVVCIAFKYYITIYKRYTKI